MKNFKIVMILVAAVAMFCSCGDPEAPTASILDANGMNEMTFDLANASVDVNATLTANDAKGLKSITLTRTSYDANNEVLGTPVEYEVKDYEGKTEYTGNITETLAKADVEGAAKVVYEAVVTNQKDVQVTATYTVNVVAAAFTEANFSWTKEGVNNPDLSAYGLKWTVNNAKAIYADIRPLDANAKLYELAAADYNANSVADITFPEAIEKYKKILADATGETTYDNVIASVYNGKTYVFHITKGTSSSSAAGTKLIIEGTVKTFEATPAVAAK